MYYALLARHLAATWREEKRTAAILACLSGKPVDDILPDPTVTPEERAYRVAMEFDARMRRLGV